MGLRAIHRIGVRRVLVACVLIAMALQVFWVITASRPDLINPTAIGSDSSNYFAAGQRLNDGHTIYGPLQPGDRFVPLIPPFSSVPLLSPPLIAVVFRPLAAIGDAGMWLWWAGIAVLLGTLTVIMALTGSARRLIAMFLISPAIGIAFWSGNMNAVIVTLLVGVWVASARGRPGIAGALLAVAACLKLTPGYLLFWFVVRRDWAAVRGFVVAEAALGVVSVIGAGLGNHIDYLNVMRDTATTGVTPFSLAGFLQNFGVPSGVADLASFAWVILGVATMWLLRRRPDASFTAGILTVIYSSPVVMLGNLAALLAAVAPYSAARSTQPAPVVVRSGLPLPGAAS